MVAKAWGCNTNIHKIKNYLNGSRYIYKEFLVKVMRVTMHYYNMWKDFQIVFKYSFENFKIYVNCPRNAFPMHLIKKKWFLFVDHTKAGTRRVNLNCMTYRETPLHILRAKSQGNIWYVHYRLGIYSDLYNLVFLALIFLSKYNPHRNNIMFRHPRIIWTSLCKSCQFTNIEILNYWVSCNNNGI